MHTGCDLHNPDLSLSIQPLDFVPQRVRSRQLILCNVSIRGTDFAEYGHSIVACFAVQDVFVGTVEAAGTNGLLDCKADGRVFGFGKVLLEGEFEACHGDDFADDPWDTLLDRGLG